jgi:hypothetical protein
MPVISGRFRTPAAAVLAPACRARQRPAHATDTLPMPATVILGPGRTVRWVDVHPDYTTRTEPRQVIDALGHLGG